MKEVVNAKYFLGSNTKRGFVPLFDKLKDPEKGHRFYILKGGPGSGKSTLMRRIAETLKKQNHFIEYMPCASDPESLDAIYDHDAGVVIVDGTAPHILDPDYPGAYDMIINLGEAWSTAPIKQKRQEIIELNHEISGCHKKATACIKAAASLLDNNRLIAKKYLDHEAVSKFLADMEKKLEGAAAGRESHRLLSAVTVGKTLFFADTIASLCPEVYSIEDEWGGLSETVLAKIREFAIGRNLALITCYCSISTPDKIDHILFPSIGLAISTANTYHKVDTENTIKAEDLMKAIKSYDLESMKKHAGLAKELINLAGEHVAKAKALHDKLEKYYISAMDYNKVEEIYQRLIADIFEK